MCEITRKNFEEKYPQIIEDLKSATFISIDCEFSGLLDGDEKCSLFDTPQARFDKLQNSLKDLIILQFGLSTFQYERQSNSFTASSYTFYLMPTALVKNSMFMCQTRSIEFLCSHKFDFNKLFRDGVTYLNKSKEQELWKVIEDKSSIDQRYLWDLQKYCSQVAEWSIDARLGSETVLNVDGNTSTFVYFLHQEIRKEFPNIWTFMGEPGVIKIKKVTESEKNKLLMEKEHLNLKKKIFDLECGFTKVMNEIEALKKPIIGHNFLTDLIMIYKQFYDPAPISYNKFKKNILKIFPKVYDTKTMSFELRKILSKDDCWSSNTLPELYNYLKSKKATNIVICSPAVNFVNEDFLIEKNFHDAGFDSYSTGFCFVKMAHMFSLWNKEKQSFSLTLMPISTSWLFGAVDFLKNRVNLIRAQVNCISLDSNDPESTRPGLLFITSRKNKSLEVEKITEMISKYASVDIRLLDKCNGLMAVANQKQVEQILKQFKNHKEIMVTKYDFLKHSISGWMFAAGAIVVSLLAVKYALHEIELWNFIAEAQY